MQDVVAWDASCENRVNTISDVEYIQLRHYQSINFIKIRHPYFELVEGWF